MPAPARPMNSPPQTKPSPIQQAGSRSKPFNPPPAHDPSKPCSKQEKSERPITLAAATANTTNPDTNRQNNLIAKAKSEPGLSLPCSPYAFLFQRRLAPTRRQTTSPPILQPRPAPNPHPRQRRQIAHPSQRREFQLRRRAGRRIRDLFATTTSTSTPGLSPTSVPRHRRGRMLAF